MKAKKIWGMFALMTFALSFSFVSCGDDHDDDEGNGNKTENTEGKDDNGGGASASKIVGSYKAITGPEYNVSIEFRADGKGKIRRVVSKSASTSAKDITYQFAYSMNGESGEMVVDYGYNDIETYNIKFAEGFMMIEEADGDSDIKYILYREGANLGKADTKKVIGTWWKETNYKDEWNEYYEKFVLNIKSNGTIAYSYVYKDYEEPDENEEMSATLSYKMLNAYIIEATGTLQDPDHGSMTVTEYGAVIDGHLYLFDSDGEVESSQILSKK